LDQTKLVQTTKQHLSVQYGTLDGLLGAPPPLSWDDVTYARAEPSEQDRIVLGPPAERLPLFG
jgi:hypothetical protein